MRILFISNFYPPHRVGGWEQLVEEINLELRSRGHKTHVLTSNYLAGADSTDRPGVGRVLHLESDLYHYKPYQFFFGRSQRLRHNLSHVQGAITKFDPDVLFIHGMWNLSRRIAWQAEQLKPRSVVYYVASDWPYAPDIHVQYWQDPARTLPRRFLKRIMAMAAINMVEQERRGYPLNFRHVLCVSQAVRMNLATNADIPMDRMHVIYNGIRTDQFVPKNQSSESSTDGNAFRLIYAGSLASHKGVHTAIEAMDILAQQKHRKNITLTIVGSGHPEYVGRLKSYVAFNGLETSVRFRGSVPRGEMPDLLRAYDALVLPSICEEALARIVQEAMSSGLVVIGTTTGGMGEILLEGDTGLTFEPQDAFGLAKQIDKLCDDRQLAHRLALQGRRIVLEKFDIYRMVDQIVDYFLDVLPMRKGAKEFSSTSRLDVKPG